MGNPQSGPGARAAPAGRHEPLQLRGRGPRREQTADAGGPSGGGGPARGPRQGEARLGKGTW